MTPASFAPCRPLRRSTVVVARESLEKRVLFSTLVVDTLDDSSDPDDGLVSLREAVQLANANPGDDRITFADAVRGTITLSLGQLDITDASGNLTIDGPGAAALSVSGNNATRVLQIGSGASANITGLTITAGRADMGGGVYSVGGTLSVAECSFDGNRAVGPGGNGGGIYAEHGSVAVAAATFSGNTADQRGGGVYIEAATSATNLTVVTSTFNSNAATDGGAIGSNYYSHYSTLDITNSTFQANKASGRGGAIYGGGDISGSMFLGNTAGAAGGGIWQFALGNQNLNLANCTFQSNKAGGGGAVGVNDGTRPTITNCTFRNNRSEDGGGAVSFGLTSRVTITGTVFESNEGGRGGALIGGESHFTIRDTQFLNNSSKGDGGAMWFVRCDGAMDKTTFIGNVAFGGSGGGIRMRQAEFTITNSRFELNRAAGRDGTAGENGFAGSNGASAEGGAIAIDSDSSGSTITATAFIGNTARGGNGGARGSGANGGTGGAATGGAITNWGGPWTVLTSCILLNNRALAGNGGEAGAEGTAGKGGNASGGALYGFPFQNSMGRPGGSIADCTIAANAAIGGNGGNAGARGIAGGGGNAAGGGFAAYYETIAGLIERCTLLANVAAGGAGGAAFDGAARGSGGNAFGGGFYLPAPYPNGPFPAYSISRSQIIRNRAIGGTGASIGLGQGGGIYTGGPTVYVDAANRVSGNYASGGFDDLFGPVVRRRPDALLRSLAVRQE